MDLFCGKMYLTETEFMTKRVLPAFKKGAAKDGELGQVTSLDRYGPMHDPKTGDNKDTVYLQDGKDIKEDVFEEAWNKYADEKFIITYDEKNTF